MALFLDQPTTSRDRGLRRNILLWFPVLGDVGYVGLFNGHDSGSDSLEVPIPYIFGLFFSLCKGISPQNTALYGTVPPI